MSYKCSHCGNTHDELPRYFMWHAPETDQGRVIDVVEDSKSMCRGGDSQFFVHCEIELPLAEAEGDPLGCICWVEVSLSDYQRLIHFRENEDAQPHYADLVEGKLANPVQGIAHSYGTPVKFKVIKGDPTPYIKWVAPGTAIAAILASGVSMDFWHDVAAGRLRPLGN
ncbi:MAG TPA: DUF2199 domain-containing protein [Polaromonas sp.]|uniref:DUF2199 domain-containing protein n=1 Tax=Polaromonas sp. TaxID=1869339 RepID=UPI002D2E16FD|nr:DUF2199 domain-containing protein [Polaromonas sp.]HYW56202.1 DUF2199 domain-containing protein [Polaromonas sp.]